MMLHLVRFSLIAVAVGWIAADGPGQRQFASLARAHLPDVSRNTVAIHTGDIDGDGDADLVLAGPDDGLSLLLNEGAARFTDVTTARLPRTTRGVTDVALRDFDGDGDLDLFAGVSGQDSLFLNDGLGRFSDVTSTRLPSNSRRTVDVEPLDIDGDGDLDLFLASGDPDRLYLNDGTATFRDVSSSLPSYNASLSTRATRSGDVDGDGDADLVLLQTLPLNGPMRAKLYLNDATGKFTDATPTNMPAIEDGAAALALFDADGDGDLDVALARFDQDWLYLNDGAGVFSDVTATNMPADYGVSITITAVDVERDGDTDLVFGNHFSRNTLYRNDGTGTFIDDTDAGFPADMDYTRSSAAFDADGDGDLDLVLGNSIHRNRLYVNRGNGTFFDSAGPRVTPEVLWLSAVALGDVDGDGDVDVACGRIGAPNSHLLLNDGTGSFTDVTASRIPRTMNSAAVDLGDVDLDGDLDLLLGNSGVYGPPQNGLFLNDGGGQFTDATASLPVDSGSTHAIRFADVDADGDLDVLAGNSPFGGTAQTRLWLNDGTGTFSDVTAARMPADGDTTYALSVGDVDRDGDIDLLLGNWLTRNRLYLNDGAGTFRDETAARLPVDSDPTQAVLLVDFDHDGDLDAVIGNYATGSRSRLYVNDGTGRFADETATRWGSPTDWVGGIAADDVDEDGDVDLALGRNGRNLLLLNDGAGHFVDASTRYPDNADWTSGVVLADVDEDGDVDLFPANALGQSELLVNLHRQISASYLPYGGHGFELVFHARPGYGRLFQLAVGAMATRTTRIPVPPFGTWRLDPATMIELPPVYIPPGQGRADLTLPVPATPVLRGLDVHFQFAFVDPDGRDHFSSLVSETIQ